MSGQSGDLVVVACCEACGAGGHYPGDATETVCPACGGVTSYRQCGHCWDHLAFGPHLRNSRRWRHPSCGYEAASRRWRELKLSEFRALTPPSLTAFYKKAGLHPFDVFGNPGRRHCHGTIVEARGVLGRASGRCRLYFEDGFITVCIETGIPFTIPFSAVAALQVGGREAWIHTLVYLRWQTGSLLLLNENFRPPQVASFLEPVVNLLESQGDVTPINSRDDTVSAHFISPRLRALAD